MPYRRVALLLILYLSLDLTNPFAGAAFNFDATQSIEGVARQHERLVPQIPAVAPPAAAVPEGVEPARPSPSWRRPAPALAGWLVQLRQAHAPHSDPQSPTDDH
jgi:hypothetical protein